MAIELLGPLSIAAVGRHSRQALVWSSLAMVAVALGNQPWQGALDALGLVFAALSAPGWATYIVLMQKLGDRFEGLSLTVPISEAFGTLMALEPAFGVLVGAVVLRQIPVLGQVLGIAARLEGLGEVELA